MRVLSLALMLTAMLALPALSGGCEAGKVQAEIEQTEQRIGATEERLDQLGTLEASLQDLRNETRAAIQSTFETLKAAIGEERAREAVAAAEAEASKLDAELSTVRAAMSAASERVKALSQRREALGDELVEAKERDEAWLGLGDTAAEVIGLALGIPTLVGAGWGLVKAGTVAGEKKGAAATARHIKALRADPEIDKAFSELDPKVKKAADAVLELTPRVLAVINAHKK